MKKINCPKCGKELINLTPTYKNNSYYWCDDCYLEIRIKPTPKLDEMEDK